MTGRLAEAQVRLADLRRLAPDRPETWLQRGLLLRATGEAEAARDLLGEGAGRHPAHLGLALQHAITLRHCGDAAGSADALVPLRHAHPEAPGVLVALIEALRETCRFDEAHAAVRDLEAIHPDQPQTLLQAGLTARHAGDHGKAADLLVAASERFPGNAMIGLQAVLSLRLAGRHADGLDLLDRLVGRFPGYVPLGMERVAALFHAGRTDEAEAQRARLVDAVAAEAVPALPREVLDLGIPAMTARIGARRRIAPPAVAARLDQIARGAGPGDSGTQVGEARSPKLPPMLIVIGMHRAGTSALARALCAAGGRVPGTAMPGDRQSNPEGHFEPWEVVGLHNRALMARGLAWHSLGSAPAPGHPVPDLPTERSALAELLATLAEGEAPQPAGPWVIKDPRICRLLALWEPLATPDAKVQPLLILRSPTAIADSLRRRDGMPASRAHLLWARHYAEALAAPISATAPLLVYEDADAKALAAAVASFAPDIDPGALPRLAPRKLPAPDGTPVDHAYARFRQTRERDRLRRDLEDILAPLDLWPEVLADADRAVLTTRS